jgi:hypothetical protein
VSKAFISFGSCDAQIRQLQLEVGSWGLRTIIPFECFGAAFLI